MAEMKPGDRAYEVAKKPEYDPVIRALKTSDPANADTIFNPLFGQIINNIHAVYQSAGNQNLLINGDFSVWQRGAAFSIPRGCEMYTADRWAVVDLWKDNNTKVVPSEDVPTGETGKSIALQINEAPERDWLVYQHVEEKLTFGEQYTISAWIKGPAGAIVTQTINDLLAPTHVLTGQWQYIKTTLTITNDNRPYSRISALRRPSKAGTYLIKNIKLEKGPVATPFIKRSMVEEKKLCQRYYMPIKKGTKLWVTSGYKDHIWVAVPLQIPMRIAPILSPPPNGFLVSDMCVYNEVYDMVPGNTTLISDNAVEFFLHKVNHGYKVPYVLATQNGGALDAEIYI